MTGMGHNRPPAELLRSIDVFLEIRRACAAAGGQKAWASAHGIAPQHLNDVLNCRREISDRVLAALGLVRVERYARTSIAAPAAQAGRGPLDRVRSVAPGRAERVLMVREAAPAAKSTSPGPETQETDTAA